MTDPDWQMTYEYFLERWESLDKSTRPFPGNESHVIALRGQIAYYVGWVHKKIASLRIEAARRADELAACKAKAKAWDTFVDDFYRHGTAVDWKAFQDLRRSVGDFRMDVDERVGPFASVERIGQYMAGLSEGIKADNSFGAYPPKETPDWRW